VDASRVKDTLQAKLATADHVTENLRAELSDAGREKESLQAKLATADHEKDSLKSELVDAGREKESLQAKLATADRDTEGLRAEISAAGDERSILKAELTNADREKSKLRAKLATADRKPTDMNLQDLFFQPPWQTGTTVGLAIALMILLFALVKMGPRRNENASKEECTRCDKIQKQVFTLKKSIEDATKEFDTLTVRNAEVCEALQESNERVGMADSSAEEMRSMLESIKVGLSFNFNWNSSADERKKEFEASLADHVKMLESLKESNIGSQIDALKDLLHEANIARSLADEKARSEAAERDLSQQEAKIKEQSLSSDIARLQNDHDLLRATAQERLAEAECLAMANAKAGQDLASAQEECHNAQAKARELQTKLDAVREAIMQAHSTVDLRGAEARGNLESTEAMASDLKSQVDQARLEQRQASENAQAKLNKMHEELASANSVAAIAQAELDALREAQRKAQEEAEKKLRSAFGEVSDMKEKCAYFMQALKNEKQAGTDLRISAVKKVREELNTSKERVKELEAELQLSNSGGKYSAGRAEE
jgi:chromosome segregation ATPase